MHGKRFVYKFVCDLQQLLGYTANELRTLVFECADNSLNTDIYTRTLLEQASTSNVVNAQIVSAKSISSASPILISQRR